MTNANSDVHPVGMLVGRILMSLIFVLSGFGKIGDFAGTTFYMESHGMPLPALFLLGAIAFEVLGGLSLATGFKGRWGAAALIVFLIPATLIFHAFWTLPEAEQRPQMIHFMKNLSILGALIFYAAVGPGPISFDGRRSA